MVAGIFDMSTIRHDATITPRLLILLTGELGESPLVRHNDLLTPRELVLAASEGLNDNRLVGILGANRDEDLSNVHSCNNPIWFAKGPSHTSLQTIGTSTRKHLVDADDVEGMNTHAHVE